VTCTAAHITGGLSVIGWLECSLSFRLLRLGRTLGFVAQELEGLSPEVQIDAPSSTYS